jgi:hypothetical protein
MTSWGLYHFFVVVLVVLGLMCAADRTCLTYGQDLAPSSVQGILTAAMHARACQDLCAASTECGIWYFWENGACSLHILSPGERRLQLASKGADGALSEADFNKLPRNIRGGVLFDAVNNAYKSLQQIWAKNPDIPIHTKDHSTWGELGKGRVEGRIIASLRSLGLLSVTRDNGILMTFSTPVEAKETVPQTGILWQGDDDRKHLDKALNDARETLRFVSGN